MDITSYMFEKNQIIESKLKQLVSEKNVAYNELFRAARYSLFSGGKRLRPILALATAEIFDPQNSQKTLNAACAIEMIHTYSLIHDDMPCMDDDDYRRGKPSLHKAFGEAHAVLTGDYLLTLAFEVIAQDDSLSSDKKIDLITLLTKHSGAEGMIGGQVMDIESEGKAIDLEKLSHIHRCKTGAMITASIEVGAIISAATPNEVAHLRQFGNDIGFAFQIIDDVIDVTASYKKGKTISSDQKNSKITFVNLLGIESAKNAAQGLLTRSLEHLQKLPINTKLLQELAKCLVQRNY
jgi:geranylgeranyl diphosphate synthase, type II